MRPAPGRGRRVGPGRRRAGRVCGGARCPTPRRSSHAWASRRASARGTPWARSPYAVLARALRCGNSAPSCGTQATPRRCGGSAVTSVSPRTEVGVGSWGQAEQGAQQGGLAGTVGADDGDGGARLGVEGELVEAGDVRRAGASGRSSRSRRARQAPGLAAGSGWSVVPAGRRLGGGAGAGACRPAAAQGDQHDHGDREQQQRDGGRRFGIVLEQQIDLERERLGGAGQVAREGDGGAELSERPCPGEGGAGEEPGRDHGHGDGEEDADRRGAQRGGGLLVARPQPRQRAFQADHEERHRHECGGDAPRPRCGRAA